MWWWWWWWWTTKHIHTRSYDNAIPVLRTATRMETCDHYGKRGTQMKRCSACQQRWYCDKVCQRAGWKNHKVFCRRIQNEVHLLPSTSDAAAPYNDRAARMFDAVEAGDVRLVRSLLDAGVYANVRHPETGCTALHTAAALCPEGRMGAMVELLRERGADTETRDTTENRDRPIDVAASEGRCAAVAALVSAGASVQVPEDDGRGRMCGPLYAAAGKGHADICRTLLDFGSDVDALCGGKVGERGRDFAPRRHYRRPNG